MSGVAELSITRNRNSTVSVEEALEIVLDSVHRPDHETVTILEAADRVLSEDIISDIMVPPLDDSAMDGYAIIADDTHGASKNSPVRLQIAGEIQAGGSTAGKKVTRGTAIRIMTGAPVPEGADSVVQFEDTEENGDYVKIFHETLKYKNYRFAGENIRKGDTVLRKGDRLSSADVGILASLNYDAIEVYKRPTVSIISTGDELADIGQEIRFGQIRDVNAYTLYSEIKRYGAVPVHLGIAKDTLKDTKEMFLRALNSDVVISTGGVSMGRYDFVREIYSDLGIEVQFEWVKVKPGRPCSFGRKGRKLVFGLPGNPVSTLTSFIQFVRPALLGLMGARKLHKPVVNAFLEEDIKKPAGKVHLLRGHFIVRNNDFYVSTTGNQKSSVLRSMSSANCLIVVPEDVTSVKAGQKVAIQLIGHDEVE